MASTSLTVKYFLHLCPPRQSSALLSMIILLPQSRTVLTISLFFTACWQRSVVCFGFRSQPSSTLNNLLTSRSCSSSVFFLHNPKEHPSRHDRPHRMGSFQSTSSATTAAFTNMLFRTATTASSSSSSDPTIVERRRTSPRFQHNGSTSGGVGLDDGDETKSSDKKIKKKKRSRSSSPSTTFSPASTPTRSTTRGERSQKLSSNNKDDANDGGELPVSSSSSATLALSVAVTPDTSTTKLKRKTKKLKKTGTTTTSATTMTMTMTETGSTAAKSQAKTRKQKSKKSSKKDAAAGTTNTTESATVNLTSSTTTITKVVEIPPPHVGSEKPPKGWEDIYTLVQELRRDRTAPCDFEGGEALPEPGLLEIDPKTHRFQILIALMLSSQTKDAVVGQAMRNLQEHGLTVDNILQTSHEDLDKLIQKVGFHNNKTKYIKQVVQILRDEYDDDIPPTAAEMIEKLPGVGPKMAYIIENAAWGVCSGIGVDTHMHRIFNQLKWVKTKTGGNQTKTPEQTRLSLEAWLPYSYWSDVNLLWVGFGQESQQQKPKMLRKALECSRPDEAVRLLKRLGMNVKQEAAKMDKEVQSESGDDANSGTDSTVSWSQRVDQVLKRTSSA